MDLAALTNGLLWWLYLPKANGSWEQRKFFAIDIRQQSAAAVVEHFTTFLSRSAVASGAAFRAATDVLDGAKRQQTIIQALPIAWQRLSSEPDELLVDLIAEAVESQCGYRPEASAVAEFLLKLQKPATYVALAKPQPRTINAPPPQAIHVGGAGYTGRTPASFAIFGQRSDVHTWKDILIGVAVAIHGRHAESFERVLSLKGRKRPYFARQAESLFSPAEIPGSPYYAETNLSANDIVRRCHQLLALFDHPVTALTIEIQ